MKKQYSFLLLSIIVVLNSCYKKDYTSVDYLKTVLNNLEKIESASYEVYAEHWNIGDTVATLTNSFLVKEYANPSDSTIGSSFVRVYKEDVSKVSMCYDGQMAARFYNDLKRITIDSFTTRPIPFRPIKTPFFNQVQSIIKYAIETNDSISVDIEDLKDSVFLRLTIYVENEVAFFGKAYHLPLHSFSPEDGKTIYELWIDKSTHLPYKYRRERPFHSSVSTCKNYKLNHLDIEQFNATAYFPEDYEVRPYGVRPLKRTPHDLVGKEAPDWTLQTTDKSPVSLADLKSKVLMIQFTSVSCSPCKASIPFLNELSSKYNKDEFDLVAIEVTSKNSDVVKRYKDRNDITYKFLPSTEAVRQDYSITSFPVFFILDENREIKQVLNGYGKGSTDKKIINLINDHI